VQSKLRDLIFEDTLENIYLQLQQHRIRPQLHRYNNFTHLSCQPDPSIFVFPYILE